MHIANRVKHATQKTSRSRVPFDRRLRVLQIFFLLLLGCILARLFVLQVIEHGFYDEIASNAHDVFERLVPVRGDILIKDADGKFYPVATNKDTFQVFAEPRIIKDPVHTADVLAPMLAVDHDEMVKKITGTGSYAAITRGISEDLEEQVLATMKAANITGIHMTREPARTYPEQGMGGQLLGFVATNDKGENHGKYGVESFWDKELSGTPGTFSGEKDVAGHLIPMANEDMLPAVDGASIVLTIDRTIQFFACKTIAAAVAQHQADSGSVIIMNPKTGDILAMCGAPDFDPNNFSKVSNVGVFNNPAIFDAYEPGSVMKAITMAAALDQGKVTSKSTYDDTGALKFGPYTIKNSDLKAHGISTMEQVLDESLNTGAAYAAQLVGTDVFRTYLANFGFGARTGVQTSVESAGDISSLKKPGEIFTATASFGQGITVSPIQMLMAYGAIANNGLLMAPRLVSEVQWSDTHKEPQPVRSVRQVISARAATILGGMLVSVVENGHGKKAGVPGYWVAGKTGTAQVASSNGTGYRTDETIGTFAGYAPVEDPKFVMILRIDHPRDVQYAESSAAPAFGEIAKFLLDYYHVQPNRPIVAK